MTLQEFASTHKMPQTWLDLREQCEALVQRSDFWYRPDLQNEARRFAVKASDMLADAIKAEQADSWQTSAPSNC